MRSAKIYYKESLAGKLVETNEGDYVIFNLKTNSIDLATDNPKDFPKLKIGKKIYKWDPEKDGAD